MKEFAEPTPLAEVRDGLGHSVTIWPWTGDNLTTGTLGTPGDPVNLVFFDNADPRAIRAALLLLPDGDRSAFGIPNVAPFNCEWQDVPEGDIQAAFGEGSGWVGSVIQLACGEYEIRFHLRLFDVGGGTLGAAHFEVQAPGTATHFVLSWELAEQLVLVDFLRSGVLGYPPAVTASDLGNTSPAREIPAVIFDALPLELRVALGFDPNQTGPVDAPNDGFASVLTLGTEETGEPIVAHKTFDIVFGQYVPKPYCPSTDFDLFFVEGPVTLTQQVVFTPSGNYLSTFHAQGHLEVTPLNSATGATGETYHVEVNQVHHAILTDNVTLASSFQMQLEIPQIGSDRAIFTVRLTVGPGNASLSDVAVRCEP